MVVQWLDISSCQTYIYICSPMVENIAGVWNSTYIYTWSILNHISSTVTTNRTNHIYASRAIVCVCVCVCVCMASARYYDNTTAGGTALSALYLHAASCTMVVQWLDISFCQIYIYICSPMVVVLALCRSMVEYIPRVWYSRTPSLHVISCLFGN